MELIMIIGGYPTWNAAATEALKSRGYDVEECRTLSIASIRLETLSPALLVVSTLAGDEDPISFVRDLRKRSSVPIIVCDRDAEHGHCVEAFEAGADDYVSGACSCEELALRAQGILGRFRGNKAVASTPIEQ